MAEIGYWKWLYLEIKKIRRFKHGIFAMILFIVIMIITIILAINATDGIGIVIALGLPMLLVIPLTSYIIYIQNANFEDSQNEIKYKE